MATLFFMYNYVNLKYLDFKIILVYVTQNKSISNIDKARPN